MTTFKNTDLKSFQKHCFKILRSEILNPLFSNGKSAVFGKSAEYFLGLENREELFRGIPTVILLIFLLKEHHLPFHPLP